jgi:hypothetical protein
MAELTPSTREAARRLDVSYTTMHKAKRMGRIAREPDGQWDIAKLHLQMRESANPQLSRTSPRSRPIETYAKPDDDLTVGSALIPLIGPAYPRKQRHSTNEYSARKNCPMKASHGARASIVIAPNCGPPSSGHVKSAIHLDHLSCDEPSHL